MVFYAVNKYLIGELNLLGMNKASFKKLFSRSATARQLNYKNAMKLHIHYKQKWSNNIDFTSQILTFLEKFVIDGFSTLKSVFNIITILI